MKEWAAEADMPTKEITADPLGTMDFEGMANLNCEINALSKMNRLSTQNANRNRLDPTFLNLERTCCCGTPLKPKKEEELSWLLQCDSLDPLDRS